jgi:SAM-dependent methyltransferase
VVDVRLADEILRAAGRSYPTIRTVRIPCDNATRKEVPMSVFETYAKYYDLLYREKDYAGEAAYVHKLIQRDFPGARSVLELGSGTGKHAVMLAERAYDVSGVDRSAEMVALARARGLALESSRVMFSQGDVRSVRLGRTFDVVVSLFHVMSYQTTNEDLAAAMATAATHLALGGGFIFDCWYGPAVLMQRPEVRVKRLDDDDLSVTRVAEPRLSLSDSTVDVGYTMFVCDKKTQAWSTFNETHRMRYLFMPEVRQLLGNAGLDLVRAEEWVTGREPDAGSWSTVFVARTRK